MTTQELKKIAEKMSIVTAMMNEVQEILGKEDFEISYRNPAHVELMHAVDLADLAKVAKKKIQLKSHGVCMKARSASMARPTKQRCSRTMRNTSSKMESQL